MKTNLVRQCSLIVAAGLAFSTGCARPSAQTDQPKMVTAPDLPTEVVPATPLVSNAEPVVAVADTNAPAILERIAPAARPETVTISPGVAEVVKLAQAGVGEDVLVAYVEKFEGRFDIGAEQILYLNDLGVSGAVITSMLKHDGVSETAASALTNPPPSIIQTQVISNVPQAQVLPSYAEPEQSAPAAPEVNTQMAPPPTSAEVSYFYDTLSPYGSWIYVSGYGWCWQPTVAVSVPTWRPYVDRGRWYWSDSGWYWASDYSWGWAPFHYGRWYHHARSGWLWTPGTVWGPSWVSWRYSDGYCGWAPLPPEAHFVSGVGFTYYSSHVSVGFDFGLSHHHYSFVPLNNFCDYSPYRYVVPRARVQHFYRNTTVVNNYIAGNNNTVINRGVGRETVARASQTRIREVTVRDRPVQNVSRIRGDQIERQGNQLVAYRPQLPKDPPRIRTAQFANRAGAGQSQSSASVARPATAVRNGSSGAANLSGNDSVLPRTGGRVPSSVGARGSRDSVAAPLVQPEQPNQAGERNGRAVSQRATAGGSAESGERSAPNVVDSGNRIENRAAQPQEDAAAAQARYQRQQQLRSGPLFGSTVAGGTPAPGSGSGRRRSVETRSEADSTSGAQVQAPGAVQPESARGAQPRPQNNLAAARNAEAAIPLPGRITQPTQPTQPKPQYEAQQYNGVVSRSSRVYPETPAPQVQPRINNNGGARSSPERTVSPRQSEQSPRYAAPQQQAPRYSQPVQPVQPPQVAQPAPRQYSAPQAPRSAPSGGGGGREATPSRGERR